MLTVYLTENHFKNRKSSYSFRSSTERTLSQEDMIDAVANANTTVTKADVIAVMTELQHQFDKAVADGASVSLFMGTFCAGASGTAASSKETFNPRKPRDRRTVRKNHKVSLLFKPARIYAQTLRNIKVERIGLKKRCTPYIDMAYNSLDSKRTDFEPGDFVVVRGEYIKIAPAGGKAGLYFVSEKTGRTYRAES